MTEKFTVTNHEYINTGGNTMVSIFTVYDHQENLSRYVIANEEGFSLQTIDTITCELADFSDEMMEKVILCNYAWSVLTTEPCWDQPQFADEDWELFKYCQFAFYKEDCRYFKTKVRLPINELPTALFQEYITADYFEWAKDNDPCVETDGYIVYLNESYEPPVEDTKAESPSENLDRQLQDIKDFRRWFNDLIGPRASEEDLQKLYEGFITISVAGNSVKLPFDADVFNNVDHVLKRAIEEW